MLPQPLPPVTPPGNSIKIRLCIFVIGLVYGVGAYGINKRFTEFFLPPFLPAAAAIWASVSDKHDAHYKLYYHNIIITGGTYFVSIAMSVAIVCNMYFEFDDSFASSECYMGTFVFMFMACFSSGALKISDIAINATKPIDAEEQ